MPAWLPAVQPSLLNKAESCTALPQEPEFFKDECGFDAAACPPDKQKEYLLDVSSTCRACFALAPLPACCPASRGPPLQEACTAV